MKAGLVCLVLCLGFGYTLAQLRIPELSPPGHVVQKVGFTTISVYYERPAARGRSEQEIFGHLAPFGKVWRTGAGNCTTIAFSSDVIINDKVVPRGKYALFTIPGLDQWTVILNTDTLAYGAYRYEADKDVVRVAVKPRRTERYYESLTIDVDVIPNDARVFISWLNVQIAFDVDTGLDEEIRSFIEKNLISADSKDPDLYEAASVYYLWHRQDRKQLMAFLNKGISLKDDRIWYYWKVEELMKDRKYAEALTSAQRGIDVIQRSRESESRKTELIRDFEKYIEDIKREKGKN